MSVKRDIEYLRHILRAIEDIEGFMSASSLKNKMARAAVERQISIIGEAARRVSEAMKQAHPQIAWREIIGARHVIIHDYSAVDPIILQDIIDRDLPVLKKQVATIIQAHKEA